MQRHQNGVHDLYAHIKATHTVDWEYNWGVGYYYMITEKRPQNFYCHYNVVDFAWYCRPKTKNTACRVGTARNDVLHDCRRLQEELRFLRSALFGYSHINYDNIKFATIASKIIFLLLLKCWAVAKSVNIWETLFLSWLCASCIKIFLLYSLFSK